MNWQDLIDWPGLVTGGAGAAITYTVVKIKHWRDKKRRLSRLKQRAQSQSTVVCVWIGGQNDPLPDAIEYAQTNIPGAQSLCFYRPPKEAKLDDPAIAERIMDDLIEGVREIGQGRTCTVHYFFAGMVAYAFIVPALLKNVCPVIVYYKAGATYQPLHEAAPERFGSTSRPTPALANFQIHEIPK